VDSHQRRASKRARKQIPTDKTAGPGCAKSNGAEKSLDTLALASYVGLLLAPTLFTLQANGIIAIPWLISLIIYFGVLASSAVLYIKWEKATGWSPKKRVLLGVLLSLPCITLFSYAVYNQYKRDHVSSQLKVSARVSFGHASGDRSYGIDWRDNFQDVRLTVDNTAAFPIHDLDLTVQLIDYQSGETIVGMGQVSDIGNVEFRPTDLPDLNVRLPATDGQIYNLDMRDFMKSAFGMHWKMLCPSVPTNIQLRLSVATVNPRNVASAPNKLKVLGSYSVASEEGVRSHVFEETVAVTR
jgi:hypothetical protein